MKRLRLSPNVDCNIRYGCFAITHGKYDEVEEIPVDPSERFGGSWCRGEGSIVYFVCPNENCLRILMDETYFHPAFKVFDLGCNICKGCGMHHYAGLVVDQTKEIPLPMKPQES